MSQSFEEQLRRLAEVTVRVGVGLQPGQKLFINANLEARPLTRRVVEEAYKAGSRLVVTQFYDEQLSLARYRYAPRDSFEEYATFMVEARLKALDEGYAWLSILADDPEILQGQDPELIRQASQTAARYSKPFSDRISGFATNWCIIGAASPRWAQMVFPDEPPQRQMELLWEAIFKVNRVDQTDPLAAWQAHLDGLERRVQQLNAKRYAALHFRGPGTDLRVGLADGHLWAGGAGRAQNGARCVPNLPTEEVFTTPHRERVEGWVQSTKPLSLHGHLLEGLRMRFEQGQVVEAHAERGQEILHHLLQTDEGARRLGEVALVPHSSPIAQSGLLFYEALYDENAASHLALGASYDECLQNGHHLTPEQKRAAGANHSLIHIDWMIGSEQVDVDGITPSGGVEPLMRRGEWVD
ncbi:aminopeptidase [Meiothermus ruber]|jgi:aminopeptidase|uniref:Peptidase M29 aminopeptidase II n=1 Tax=Meiothermus ruber (strain ATCC 35948 / DSM 1279 / VKM B-1258 / 21) TaxID=504728 RepID=D3PT07_MEIRD|nr:aminopeptidase [Meiothermus ruber]ADD28590.1 peptidase M29 aminopeptidase II [Meiothermus ruber DSM 1279]AGK05966.1 peptidase M29 aminopeptidase II [Meiothermus ruber DSM 1279]